MLIFLNDCKIPHGGLLLILPLKREDKYLASLGIDNKLIFFHILESKVDYFVKRKIKDDYLVERKIKTTNGLESAILPLFLFRKN